MNPSPCRLFVRRKGLRVFLEKLECAPPNPLVVTHCTRDDIVLGFLAHAQNCKEVSRSKGGCFFILAVVVAVLRHSSDGSGGPPQVMLYLREASPSNTFRMCDAPFRQWPLFDRADVSFVLVNRTHAAGKQLRRGFGADGVGSATDGLR